MRLLWYVLPLLFFVFVEGSCRPPDPGDPREHACITPNDNPNPFDTGGGSTRNPAIVEGCTDTPTPKPTPTSNSSPTPIGNVPHVWYDKMNKPLHQLRRASDQARAAYPDYATNPDSTNGFASTFTDAVGNPVGAVGQLSPPPAGLETQYAALKTNLQALINALRASPPDAAAIDAAYSAYVDACSTLQQFAGANNIDVDLRCSGPITPLSATDFFAAAAPVIATMHTKAHATQATFDALAPAQQADFSTLSAYLADVGFTYSVAARDIVDLAAPTSAATAQQAFVDAANAVFTAGQQLQEKMKETSDPAALPAVAALVPPTLSPLLAAVEDACAHLQTAATAAGVSTNLGCR